MNNILQLHHFRPYCCTGTPPYAQNLETAQGRAIRAVPYLTLVL